MGYRYDFQRNLIVATGGVYVRTFPTADQVVVGDTTEKPGLFSNSVFVQNLLPEDQKVTVLKDGYYPYEKTVPVAEKEVTKLENVILFKKDIPLTEADPANALLAPVVVYFQIPITVPEDKAKFTLKSGSLFSGTVTTPILKNVLAFKQLNTNLIWLASDGVLSEADNADLSNKKIIGKLPTKISAKNSYELFSEGKYIFVRENKDIYWLNPATNGLEKIYSGINGVTVSPDQKHIMYWSDSIIFIGQTASFDTSETANPNEADTILYEATAGLQNVQWMNNHYIAFVDGSKIIISETDIRGNINAINISDQVLGNIEKTDKTIESLKTAKIYFNKPNGRLYIYLNGKLFESERLI